MAVMFCVSSSLISSSSDAAEAYVRHVPKHGRRGITQSPFLICLTLAPVEMTSATPSLPATALGEGVPSVEVNVGRVG